MSNITESKNTNELFHFLTSGDISKMSPKQKSDYLIQLCEHLGLNPLTQPFEFIKFQGGKEILYAKKDATEQLRKINGISITKLETKEEHGVFVVTAYASDKDGRSDVSTGAVSLTSFKGDQLHGDARANALMKAETKAKRRVTLSISGLGILDESEIETIKDITPKQFNGYTNDSNNEISNNSINAFVAFGKDNSNSIDNAQKDNTTTNKFGEIFKSKIEQINSVEDYVAFKTFCAENKQAIDEYKLNNVEDASNLSMLAADKHKLYVKPQIIEEIYERA